MSFHSVPTVLVVAGVAFRSKSGERAGLQVKCVVHAASNLAGEVHGGAEAEAVGAP